jgi:sulfite reductase (NADPH) flavoprotein alpha-component
MAGDVHDALLLLIRRQRGGGDDDAREYLQQLRQSGRYQRDVY